MPGASDPGVAVTLSETGADGVVVPLAGATLSQEPPDVVVALAVKESDPAPVFKTCNCWVRAVIPWVAVKVTVCVSVPRVAGVPGSTVSEMATVAVEGTALGAVMVTVP